MFICSKLKMWENHYLLQIQATPLLYLLVMQQNNIPVNPYHTSSRTQRTIETTWDKISSHSYNQIPQESSKKKKKAMSQIIQTIQHFNFNSRQHQLTMNLNFCGLSCRKNRIIQVFDFITLCPFMYFFIKNTDGVDLPL